MVQGHGTSILMFSSFNCLYLIGFLQGCCIQGQGLNVSFDRLSLRIGY